VNGYTEVNAIQVGGLALNCLKNGVSGKVMGITSKGMFLNAGDRILFLTDADYKSPFNVQIKSFAKINTLISTGEPWIFNNQILTISKSIGIDIQQAAIWHPSTPPEIENTVFDQINRMEELFSRMSAIDAEKGWLFLSESLLSQIPIPDDEIARIRTFTNGFLLSVHNNDVGRALTCARSIIGRGGGLTPSGDDWISGFLLYFARTGQQNPFIEELGQSLTSMAFKRTTKISANRIEAAMQGWSEELFLSVIDHIVTSKNIFNDEMVLHLVNFGHSSGVDTCVGIRAALSIQESLSKTV